jgi:hypothetical protein
MLQLRPAPSVALGVRVTGEVVPVHDIKAYEGMEV